MRAKARVRLLSSGPGSLAAVLLQYIEEFRAKHFTRGGGRTASGFHRQRCTAGFFMMSKFFIQTQLELVQATGRPAAERLPFTYVKGAGTQHRRAGGSVVDRSGSSERINKIGARRRLVPFSLEPRTHVWCGETSCFFLVLVLGAIEQRIKEASIRFHNVHFDGERISLDGQRSQDKYVTAVTARLRVAWASTASQQSFHTVIRVSAALSAVAHHQDAARALHNLRLSHYLQQQVMIRVLCLWLCLQQKV